MNQMKADELFYTKKSVYDKPSCTRCAKHMLAAFLPFFCVW